MTYDEARDQILAVFKASWDPTGHPVVWTDVPGSAPETETAWARVTAKHTGGGQASLAGETGTRRFDRVGTLYVQIFAQVGEGLTSAYSLAQTVSNAFEDARQDVWFRNVRIREVGAAGAFEQINVLVDFLYDDVR